MSMSNSLENERACGFVSGARSSSFFLHHECFACCTNSCVAVLLRNCFYQIRYMIFFKEIRVLAIQLTKNVTIGSACSVNVTLQVFGEKSIRGWCSTSLDQLHPDDLICELDHSEHTARRIFQPTTLL